MGLKLSNLGNDGVTYRKNVYSIGESFVHRSTRPWLHSDFVYKLLGYWKILDGFLKPVHDFTQSIVNQRRIEFLEKKNSENNNKK